MKIIHSLKALSPAEKSKHTPGIKIIKQRYTIC